MQTKTYQTHDHTVPSKIILFDLDGTLIDSTEAILEGFNKAYEKCGGATPVNEEITKLVGLPLLLMFEKLGVAKAKAPDYVTAYKKHYRTIHTQKTLLLPNVKEALAIADKSAKLGVVTTKTAKYSRELLEYFGIMHYFDILIGHEDVNNLKPHPEPILKALKALGHTPKTDAYMIGDTISDVLAAKNANIIAIGVLCGYGDREALKEADFITPSTIDAVKKIETNL